MSRRSHFACPLLALVLLFSVVNADDSKPRGPTIRFRPTAIASVGNETVASPCPIGLQSARTRTPELQAMAPVVRRRGEAKPTTHRSMDEVEDGYLRWRGK